MLAAIEMEHSIQVFLSKFNFVHADCPIKQSTFSRLRHFCLANFINALSFWGKSLRRTSLFSLLPFSHGWWGKQKYTFLDFLQFGNQENSFSQSTVILYSPLSDRDFLITADTLAAVLETVSPPHRKPDFLSIRVVRLVSLWQYRLPNPPAWIWSELLGDVLLRWCEWSGLFLAALSNPCSDVFYRGTACANHLSAIHKAIQKTKIDCSVNSFETDFKIRKLLLWGGIFSEAGASYLSQKIDDRRKTQGNRSQSPEPFGRSVCCYTVAAFWWSF